jgi:hypothetical protein
LGRTLGQLEFDDIGSTEVWGEHLVNWSSETLGQLEFWDIGSTEVWGGHWVSKSLRTSGKMKFGENIGSIGILQYWINISLGRTLGQLEFDDIESTEVWGEYWVYWSLGTLGQLKFEGNIGSTGV